jgi:hypothetical protein
MRNHKTGLVAATLLTMAALLLWFVPMPQPAQAQVLGAGNPVNYTTMIGATNVVASFTTNINAGAVDVYQNRGLSVFVYCATTNASGSNVVVQFQVSYDGTNYSTLAPPLKFDFANNGTTGVRAWTNYPAAVLSNVRKIRVGTIQSTHLSTLFITNIVASRGTQ